MIDNSCYLSFDLMELSLLLAFIRGRRKGLCAQNDPDITPPEAQRNVWKGALGSSSYLSNSHVNQEINYTAIKPMLLRELSPRD